MPVQDRTPDLVRLESSGVRTPLAPYGPYASPMVPVDAKAFVRQMVRLVRKQKWKLIHFLVIAASLACVLQFVFPRLYSATAVLRVDRHSANGAVGQEASQVATINDMDQVITTDMELAHSDPVLRPVAEKFHLGPWSNQTSRLGAIFRRKDDPDSIRKSQAAPVELQELKVTRPANTYLIRLTFRAWNNPKLAADVANGVADSLVRQINQALDQSYTNISGAIQRDMEQLRSKMDVSQKRLGEYETQLHIVDPEGRSTILTQRFQQLLTEYTAVQADRFRKQALIEGLESSPTMAATQATEGDKQRQSLLDDALSHESAARQAFVAAESYYGENHPEYRKAKQQLDEAKEQVEERRLAVNDKAAAELRQAILRENLLKQQVAQAKAELDSLKTSAMEYAQLKATAENDRKLYQDLEARTREADVNRQFRDATIQFVARALPPGDAIFPRLSLNLPVALFVALILGVIAAVAAGALDTTFSDAEEFASRMKLEPLTSLPEVPRLTAVVTTESNLPALPGRTTEMRARYEDAIRVLRNGIGLASLSESIQTILVTSPNAGDGKSTTATHLGIACAQGGKRTLLIDADLRHPSLHKRFDLATTLGLADVIAHRLSPADTIVGVDVPGLFVMPAGPSLLNAADLITLGFASVLHQVSRNFDLIIIDAPPLLGPSESQELAAMVDGVIVVAKAEATSAKALEDTLSALARTRAKLLGVVMNQVKAYTYKSSPYFYRSEPENGAGLA